MYCLIFVVTVVSIACIFIESLRVWPDCAPSGSGSQFG